ncbi:MAG: large-conductance mechanosensitive channel protein MscL [Anaerolineaceae bacterium]|jgi:large conductance mechanosensitive channel|nr:large-conductance mechanosensitive channel protein MscL [Anaerolineaceae bacterium]
MLKEFKNFIMRGNVIDLAVGVVIGSAFNQIVSSLVADIIMPPIGLLLGKVDFSNFYILLQEGTEKAAPYASLAQAQEAGAVTLNIGQFINTILSFLIVAAAVFLLIQLIERLRRKEEDQAPPPPETKTCPFCATDIPVAAVRCPNCTSELKGAE